MFFACFRAGTSSPSVRQAGVGMVEVLVTLVILAIGLLGLAGLQIKANTAEMESYQRTQALALVRGMVDVVQAARGNPGAATRASDFGSNWVSANGSIFFGFNDTASALCGSNTLTPAQQYLCSQWRPALQGAAETTTANGLNGSVGAMIGARGCLISPAVPTPGAIADFYVVVVWQGLTPTADPAADTPGAQCAPNVDFGTGLRRAASTRVLLPLQQ